MPEGIVREECLMVFLMVGGGEVSCVGEGVRRSMGGASDSADFCDDCGGVIEDGGGGGELYLLRVLDEEDCDDGREVVALVRMMANRSIYDLERGG